MAASNIVIALDVGERRIGVARADLAIGIASAVTTLTQTDETFSDIQNLLREQQASRVIVGYPRGLDGQETAQTRAVKAFADALKSHISMPITFQDEALTSRQAEAELKKRGKPYKRADIDALAAIYILEDYMSTNRQKESV